jgi:type IV secretion system protein VirB3
VTISIAVVTIAIIWAGFKMIFQGARLADVANVLIGGTLVGGAAAFASYIVDLKPWTMREAIYKGATRPAMKLGIPLVPLVVLFGTGMLLIMWGGVLLSWWIAVAVVVRSCRRCSGCASHAPRTTSASIRCSSPCKLRLHDRNRRFWHARSYAPHLYRGARDAWHV